MSKLTNQKEYHQFLKEIKDEIQKRRYKALQTVNRELIGLYWEIGRRIVEKQEKRGWGERTVENLAQDLAIAFPDTKGFSKRNLWNMKLYYLAYRNSPKLQTLSAEISWSNNLLILEEAANDKEKEFYLKTCIFEIDLLFYHRELSCLVPVELKIGKFKPEYVGKMQFYLAALDEQVKLKHEKPSVGLILCKSKNDETIRIAISQAVRKIGIASYQTKLLDTKLLEKKLHQMPLPEKDMTDGII